MKIQVGDRVAYRVRWLRSVGLCHSDAARARGVVTEMKPLGRSLILARVNWDSDMPERVNVENLARVGSVAFTSEDR